MMRKLFLVFIFCILCTPVFAGGVLFQAGGVGGGSNDRYWVGADTSWNTASNWSATSGGAGGAGVPDSNSTVYFDGSDVDNCTIDVAIDISALDVQSGYTGTLDFADATYSHVIGGDTTLAGGGIVDAGDSTITVGGNFNNKDQVTFTKGSSTVTMTGTSKTLTTSSSKDLYELVIDGTVTLSSATTTRLDATGLTVNLGKTFTLNSNVEIAAGITSVINGTLDGGTTYDLVFRAANFGASSTFNCDDVIFRSNVVVATGATINPVTAGLWFGADLTCSQAVDGDWSILNVSSDRSTTLTGAMTFNGALTVNVNVAGIMTVTGSDLITIGGNFAITGSATNTCVWTGLDLDITGTAVAQWTTVTNSDASAGTNVTATDNCTDGGGNTGWTF
jgi:hypothetical protein